MYKAEDREKVKRLLEIVILYGRKIKDTDLAK